MTRSWTTARAASLIAPPPPPEAVYPGVTASLHLNECPLPPSPHAIAAGAAAMVGVNRYPPTHGGGLVTALARHTGVPADRIALATGSDMLLHMFCMTALEPGRSAVFPRPSFPRYRLSAAIAGATAYQVALTPDGANDPDALLAAITPDTALLFCCTPNGNTGAPMSVAALRHLARSVPDHILLIVDEAYAEFDPDADTLGALADRTGPWAVCRTFSKAYALAGLRVGYALCSSPAIPDTLRAARPIFEMTAPALAAAEAALADTRHLAEILRLTVRGRTRLVAGLRALGLDPLPSRANFVTTNLHRPAAPILRAMAAEGVLCRDVRDAGYETYLRITVGYEHEIDRALTLLGTLLTKNEEIAPMSDVP